MGGMGGMPGGMGGMGGDLRRQQLQIRRPASRIVLTNCFKMVLLPLSSVLIQPRTSCLKLTSSVRIRRTAGEQRWSTVGGMEGFGMGGMGMGGPPMGGGYQPYNDI